MATIYQTDMFGQSHKVGRVAPPRKRETVGAFISLGGGVQSSTLAEMVAEGALSAAAVIFADTGDEPAYVYAQVRYLQGRLNRAGVPLVTVQAPVNLAQSFRLKSGRFASLPLFVRGLDGRVSILKRQCTNEYKIRPIRDFMLGWLDERGYVTTVHDSLGRTQRRVSRKVQADVILGISTDESERAYNKHAPQWQAMRYPLLTLNMSRKDCEDWLRVRGLPIPKKSSCKRCPYHSDAYWRYMRDDHPQDFAEVCAFDYWLRTPDGRARLQNVQDDVYIHPSARPLAEIDLDAQLPLFADGGCGSGFCHT